MHRIYCLLIIFPPLKIHVIQTLYLLFVDWKKIGNDFPKYIWTACTFMQNTFDNLHQGHFKWKQNHFFFLIKISKYFIIFIAISSLSKWILPGLSVNWLINLKRLRFKRFKDTCTWQFVHLKWTFLSCYNSICFHRNKHFGDTDNTSRDVILDWMQ